MENDRMKRIEDFIAALAAEVVAILGTGVRATIRLAKGTSRMIKLIMEDIMGPRLE